MNANLLKLWEQADANELYAGLHWYEHAHAFADSLAFWTDERVEKVCAVISALSPQLSWRRNRYVAEQMFKRERVSGILGTSERKARLILRGARPGATAFPVKSCPKTNSFYHNLVNPSDSRFVTIDRHASKAAGVDGRFDYESVVNEYKEVAKYVNVVPCQFQAVVWIVQRNGGQRTFAFAVGDW